MKISKDFFIKLRVARGLKGGLEFTNCERNYTHSSLGKTTKPLISAQTLSAINIANYIRVHEKLLITSFYYKRFTADYFGVKEILSKQFDSRQPLLA